MAKWFEMRRRLKKNETIDKVEQKQFEKENDHWKNVIFRIICIVKFLAKHNLAFPGFLNVDDTTGQGLFEVTQAELKALDLDIDDRWQILKDNVKGLTLKSLSTTRWESRVESVKAIKFQLSDIREALIQVSEKYNDSVIQSQAKSLATNELGDFEFIAAIVIWFEILNKEFQVTGFSNAVDVAKKISVEMDINLVFIQKRVIRRKRQFDEDPVEENVILSDEESFKVNYFLYIFDQAIASLITRFEHYKEYENMFGFLFTFDKLKFYDDDFLKSCCSRLEATLKNGDRSDSKANKLYVELRSLNSYLPTENMRPVDVLIFLKQDDCYPNAIIAYRVLLTIPVTVASAKRSFSK
ncbi:hypothetical protein CTI12_AA527140 [Artemisia annua]|uniref:HAT C-terminal dimerisation domain-containing protein n=1 Tax=Artemisia annua TaxID=35608 RepID=A0A2U1L5S0_ARTAN|nr:hypothetical protein CTI12_AA527140 [Artemisia annua]